MANNRLYIRCKHCGQTTYLAKNFGYEYYITNEALEHLNNFLADHAFCFEDCDKEDFKHAEGGDFELVDEYHFDDYKIVMDDEVGMILKEKNGNME